MATVYLAHDLRHDRPVAIKVLRPELAAVIGAERFLSEIKTTANLQHPHILPLFDSGVATVTAADALTTHDSRLLFYVMPYIEGESLRDRLMRDKQLSIPDAVRIAAEVAGALDYAHRRGIVHRDIKPENILLHDGRALVADFGIALAASKAGDSRMTQTGMSLGTPAYMSPEQAMGERDIGPRSDVYALGAMTYEMLVGDPPFTGSTVQSIVAKVMTEKPMPPSRIRDTIPPNVEYALLTALQKLPADRFASAKEFADALDGKGYVETVATRPPAYPPGSSTRPPRPPRLPRHPRLPAFAATALIATAAGAAGWLMRGSPRAGPATYDAVLPDSAPITFNATTSSNAFGSAVRNLSVAPDGDFVIYTSQQGDSTQLWYRSLTDASAHPVAGSRGALGPRISPDGSRIAYSVGNRVMLLPVAGGVPRKLMDAETVGSIEWLSPTELLVEQRDGRRLSWLDPESGPTRTKDVTRCVVSHWIPEDRQLICSYNGMATIMDPESGQEWVVRARRPDGSAGSPLVGSSFRLVDGAWILYMSLNGELRAAPYDRKRHLAGRSVTLTAGVRSEALGDAQIDITRAGTLVFAPGVNAVIGRIVRLRPGHAPELLPTEAAAFQRYDLSRDGRWLAAAVQAVDGQELRIYDLRDGQRSTWLRGEVVRHPLWSPAGDRLVAVVADSTRYSVLSGAPGSGRSPDTLLALDSPGSLPGLDVIDYPQEHALLVLDWVANVTRRLDPAVVPARLDTVATESRFTTVAPDGRHVAWQLGNQSGVIVTSYPTPGRRWQVASDGVEPIWLSATELLYRAGTAWYLVHISPATGEPLGPATRWGSDPRFSDTSGWSNRTAHDGGIIYVQAPAEVSAGYLRIVPNWMAQMKAAVAAANK
jgi:serine/threonine-protein kinase